MLKLKINNKEYNVPKGISVMGAARMHGIDVPSMCYREGKPHFSSCMICMVKDNSTGKLFPSCSLKVTEGMDICTDDPEVIESRRMALELMLSEHVGDCEAPCRITCPAHMDIPLMNRLLAAGRFDEALKVVKRDIALPSVFGYVCPAPCEGACHRKTVDEPVAICLLKRFAGEHDLKRKEVWKPAVSKSSGKRVAVIGAGPAGLATAYYLSVNGHAVTVFDRRDKAGGTLWDEVEKGKLPAEVLEKETGIIESTGVVFKQGAEVDAAAFERLRNEFDAVLVAHGGSVSSPGAVDEERASKFPELNASEINNTTYQLGTTNIFAAGSALKHSKMAIRAHGQGKEAAVSMDQFLLGKQVTGDRLRFNSRFGKLASGEFSEYLKGAEEAGRIEPLDMQTGFTSDQVQKEAARCMHCDCRKLDNCKLRDLSDQYDARQKHFWSKDRKAISRHVQHEEIVYEPGKCIKCGICVEIAKEHKEEYGLSFIGRGFDVVVDVPFNETIAEGLKKAGLEAADACPTGALARKKGGSLGV
jgi:NADPH-dependent glutamate synthase beta subunit-like oxidoreductase/ferredoxin